MLPSALLETFLLVDPALFSIVNPIAGAFIFNEASAGLDDRALARLARKVATYSLIVMLVAMWGGSFILGAYRYAPRIARGIGPTGSRVLARLAAFLLLAVGVQTLIAGVTNVLTPMMAARRPGGGGSAGQRQGLGSIGMVRDRQGDDRRCLPPTASLRACSRQRRQGSC